MTIQYKGVEMKKIIGLAVGAVAMVALSGCQPVGNSGGGIHSGDGTGTSAFIYTSDLKQYGFKISGRDTRAGESVDLCFDGYGNFLYGRGSTYFDGGYTIDNDEEIVFKDATDGGSYRLYTDGEIEEGVTYDFGSTLPNHNIHVESITQSNDVNDCKVGSGKKMRVFSSIKKSI
jgi:hypothetical protein